MIVWGGTGGTALGSGGLYDPLSDSWTSTASAGPAPRYLHTAVWTGSEMLVWGGLGAGGLVLGSGAAYDPAAGTWRTIAAGNAPTGRYSHTSVWTGSRMLVWGGSGSTELDSGAAYFLSTGAWSPLPAQGAPAARTGHSAAWTGSRMVVWGGSAGPSYLGTGGSYDPIAGAWASTSMVEAPPARVGQAGAWTGDSLILWGGYDGNYLATGGRYCACAAEIYFRDADADGRGDPAWPAAACSLSPGLVPDGTDCSDDDPAVWASPSEVLDLVFLDDSTMTWTPPASAGGLEVVYDVLRSETPDGFLTGGDCVATDAAGQLAADAEVPAAGAARFYLVRAQNGCPNGEGPLGTDSSGIPCQGRSCP